MNANACKRQNVTHKRGTVFFATITAKEDDGTAMDLSGYGCRMQIKTDYEGTTIATAESEGESPAIILSTGIIEIALPVPDDAPVGKAVYDIILMAADGNIAVADGVFEITHKVTDTDTAE